MKTIEELNKKLEEIGIEPIETRKGKKIFVVINDVGSDIGNEFWGAFESREEALKEAENCLYRYSIEESVVYFSEESYEV